MIYRTERSRAIVAVRCAIAVLALGVVLHAAPAAADVIKPIAFPVEGPVRYTDTFGAARSGGRTHEGTDVMAAKMQRLLAAVDGTVTRVQFDNLSAGGNSVTIRGADGWTYHYLHVNNDTPGTDDGGANRSQAFPDRIVVGAKVMRGEVVGYVGDSGNAESTAAHLHFEIRMPPEAGSYSGTAINPYASLREAEVSASTEPDGPTGPRAPSPRLTRTLSVTGSYSAVVGDFRGVGHDDILWYSKHGSDVLWRSAGDGTFAVVDIDVAGTLTPYVADFNGDGRDDIYWFSPTEGDAIYYGTADGSFWAIYPNSNGDYTAHLGDFNGDGLDDIYWFSSWGGDAVYYGTPNGFSATYPNANGGLSAHPGDYDGDGYDDIYWFSPTDGDAIYYGGPGGFRATYPNSNGDYRVLVGDYDGDGVDDIYWFSTWGGDALYYGNPGGFSAVYPNIDGPFRPAVIELDAVGGDDIVWYAPTTASDWIWRSTGNRPSPFTSSGTVINGAYTPVVGQFDSAVGRDILWYEPSAIVDALWYG